MQRTDVIRLGRIGSSRSSVGGRRGASNGVVATKTGNLLQELLAVSELGDTHRLHIILRKLEKLSTSNGVLREGIAELSELNGLEPSRALSDGPLDGVCSKIMNQKVDDVEKVSWQAETTSQMRKVEKQEEGEDEDNHGSGRDDERRAGGQIGSRFPALVAM